MSKRDEIKEYVNKFAEGFVKLLREAAHETVDATFAAEDGDATPAPKVTSTRRAKAVRGAKAPRALPAANGAITVAMIVDAVRRNPGCDGSVIGSELGKPRWAIKKPLAEAIALGKVRKTGNGRGVSYTAGR